MCVVMITGSCTDTAAPKPRAVKTTIALPATVVPPAITVGVMPKFVDVSATSGITRRESSVRTCTETATDLRIRFSGASFDRGDRLNGAACQIVDFAAGVAIGDFNNDGLSDIYATFVGGPGQLFVNDGGGKFHDGTADAGLDALDDSSVGAAFVDIDRDGDQDLFVTTLFAKRYWMFVNDGRGHFVDEARARGIAAESDKVHVGFSIAIGDYDRDGYSDVFVSEYPGLFAAADPDDLERSRLFRNLGRNDPGRFEDVTSRVGISDGSPLFPTYAFGATFRDLDNDGWLDLAVTGDFGTSRMFFNDRGRRFVDESAASGMGTEENGMGSTTADIDFDGDPDRFVSSIRDGRGAAQAKDGNWGTSGNRLFTNLGERRFTDRTDAANVRDGGWGWGAAFVDFTNTSSHSLVQVSGMQVPISSASEVFALGPTKLWVTDRAGQMVDVAAKAGLLVRNGRGLATADFDGDGRIDVLIGHPGLAPTLYRNISQNVGHFVRVRIQGTSGQSEGIGARVRVEFGDRVATVEVQSVTDFLGQSERIAHIGVGDHTTAQRVTVTFPATGRKVELRDVAVDQVIEIDESMSR